MFIPHKCICIQHRIITEKKKFRLTILSSYYLKSLKKNSSLITYINKTIKHAKEKEKIFNAQLEKETKRISFVTKR